MESRGISFVDKDNLAREGALASSNESSTKSYEDVLSSECDQLGSPKTNENAHESEKAIGYSSDEIRKSDYELVDEKAVLQTSIQFIKDTARAGSILAIDCEGDKLSRKGKLLLLSVATNTKAFLIDLKALKTMPFETGLRDILEDASVKKLMFDCRADADALLHQFQVKLSGVIDIQLLDVMRNQFDKAVIPAGRRSERHGEVFRVRGLLDCIKTYLSENKILIEQKMKGAGSLSDWDKRPLKNHEMEYAKTDVLSLFMLFEKLKPDEEEMKRLEIASAIYVDMKRSILNRSYDKFEDNGYLPIDVIPQKGKTTFDIGYVSCTTCKRMFPYDEFSKSQLKKCVQKCRTCKRVKNDIDVQANRERNYERNDCYELYYSDSDNGFGYGGFYDSDSYGAGHDYDDDYGGYDSDW